MVGLILGLFASRYQKRKEVELKIKSELLLKRLETLEKINRINAQILCKVAPSSIKQREIVDYLEVLVNSYNQLKYRRFMATQFDFDTYYNEANELLINERIYLDYNIERIYSEYLNYLTEIKQLMDAAWEVFEGDVAKLDFSFNVLGVALEEDFNRFYAKIDQTIAKQMRNINLSYKDQYFKKRIDKIRYKLGAYLEKHLREDDFKAKLSRKIYYNILYKNYGGSYFVSFYNEIKLILLLIYLSDKYTVKEFFELSENDKNMHFREFQIKLINNQHV